MSLEALKEKYFNSLEGKEKAVADPISMLLGTTTTR